MVSPPGQQDQPDQPEVDWFGHPLPARQGGRAAGVPCPLCEEPFDDRAALAGHLADTHDITLRTRSTSRFDRLPGWARSLGFLPLWFVLPMTAALMTVVFLAVRPYGKLVAVYAASLASIPLVLALYHRVFVRRVD